MSSGRGCLCVSTAVCPEVRVAPDVSEAKSVLVSVCLSVFPSVCPCVCSTVNRVGSHGSPPVWSVSVLVSASSLSLCPPVRLSVRVSVPVSVLVSASSLCSSVRLSVCLSLCRASAAGGPCGAARPLPYPQRL